MTGLNEIENVYGETVEFYDLSALSQIGNKKIVLNKFADMVKDLDGIILDTQGRLRYETYITDIKQVGMDQWTWRLTYKVFCGKNIVSTVDSLMSWNYQSVEKILNQLTKMHFRTAKLSETLLLAIKAR